MDKVEVKGEGDYSVDWVGAYEKVLQDIGQRNGTKLVIHIVDTSTHGKLFNEKDKPCKEGNKFQTLLLNVKKRN